MVFHTEDNNYSEEEVAELWELYHKANPYSELEMQDWKYDGGIDGDRIIATEAGRIIQEMGLLNTR